MRLLPREIETFWTLFTAPIVWALHFLVCYLTAAIFCAKGGSAQQYVGLQLMLGALTLLALVSIAISAYLAWRQWGFGTADPPHDESTDRARRLFQGFATLLLSALSFVAVLFVATPIMLINGCFS
ncbi:hypothetical protein [Ensifer sp. Root127]|jgi:Kef-type K+ transport system membrane component KefB|uniref:hypothetical protein n=1 Tax=Ensifer sp. Root127 TaxID=1736440 RepID=UPI00070F60CE|nr:hypothetical protein [Ensifer sp. Root127]KQW55623.1 hypothetical protein ASD03_18870 [Ensifer sp. Root127]